MCLARLIHCVLLRKQQQDEAPGCVRDHLGRSPLWIAAYYGNQRQVEYLLQHGADRNQVAVPLCHATSGSGVVGRPCLCVFARLQSFVRAAHLLRYMTACTRVLLLESRVAPLVSYHELSPWRMVPKFVRCIQSDSFWEPLSCSMAREPLEPATPTPRAPSRMQRPLPRRLTTACHTATWLVLVWVVGHVALHGPHWGGGRGCMARPTNITFRRRPTVVMRAADGLSSRG